MAAHQIGSQEGLAESHEELFGAGVTGHVNSRFTVERPQCDIDGVPSISLSVALRFSNSDEG
jgi:hypothetical protein